MTTETCPSNEAVLFFSEKLPENAVPVRGYDFEQQPFDFSAMLSFFRTTGFQATNLALAIEEINKMLAWHPAAEALAEMDEEDRANPAKHKCKIFLGYTSNMVSCGNREVIRFLVKHRMVDVLVTSAGGIEEDFIKCLAPLYMGDFHLSGSDLRRRGLNRIGNLIMPNSNYVKFESWLNPILEAMLDEQKKDGTIWSPSKMIDRLGKEINNEESIYYWAWKNRIPVYCPAITDGSIGDMIYFHSYKNPGLVLDLVSDIRGINNEAVHAPATGMIILGGGVVKHHICNANLMRNGADFSVYVNTGLEYDGSDSGASPDEAVSWGKIKMTATPVKVSCEASIAFPLIVAETFAKQHESRREALNLGRPADSLYL